MTTDIIYFLCQQVLIFFVPLLIVGIGDLISERSGVLNIALEGIMVFGAFAGIIFIHFCQDSMPVWLCLTLAILISMAAGTLLTSLHAFASIHLKAEQTISSTAINTFATAFGLFFGRILRVLHLLGAQVRCDDKRKPRLPSLLNHAVDHLPRIVRRTLCAEVVDH